MRKKQSQLASGATLWKSPRLPGQKRELTGEGVGVIQVRWDCSR